MDLSNHVALVTAVRMAPRCDPSDDDGMNTSDDNDATAGREVDADDPGVPDDQAGPDVPDDPDNADGTDVPANPSADQPEGTEGVDGADPGDDDATTEEMAETDQDESADDSGGGGSDVADDIGAPTKPAEPA